MVSPKSVVIFREEISKIYRRIVTLVDVRAGDIRRKEN